MKLLSCKFQMIESFNCENFYEILTGFLHSVKSYAEDMGEQFEKADKSCAKLRTRYCLLETSNIDDYRLIKFTNTNSNQEWSTEAIFDGVKKSVTLHICCNGDTSQFSVIPEMRTAIVRAFVASGLIKKDKIALTDKPVEAGAANKQWLVNTAVGKEINALPVVFLSKTEGMLGYAVDEMRLARKLAGIAHVIVEAESDFAFNLRDITGGKLPYNGNIGVFYPDERQNKNYKFDKITDRKIINEVTGFVTALTDKDGIDWDKLHARENGALVDILDDESAQLKSELEEKERRIKELEAKCDWLQSVVDGYKTSSGIIEPAAEEELFDFEQHDLIVSALETALKGSVEGTRRYDLLNSLLEANIYKNVGREIFERAAAIIEKGKLTDRDFKELDKLGFELVRDGVHDNFIFRGENKYLLTFPSTPSDARSGKNTCDKILNKISIYK